jgi:hypothetical protein
MHFWLTAVSFPVVLSEHAMSVCTKSFLTSNDVSVWKRDPYYLFLSSNDPYIATELMKSVLLFYANSHEGISKLLSIQQQPNRKQPRDMLMRWLWGHNSTYRLCGLLIRISGYRFRGPGFDSRLHQFFWEVVGLERGPLSLVNTIEELLGRKSSGSGLENREYGLRDPSRYQRDTPLSLKLALTSLTSGGRSVDIVHSRTRHGVFYLNHNSAHYPSYCHLFKKRFQGLDSASSGGTYWVRPNRTSACLRYGLSPSIGQKWACIIQSPKHCVLNKDRTMDNVHNSNSYASYVNSRLSDFSIPPAKC